MTLIEVIANINSFDREDTIYVAEPWAPDSIALVTVEPESGRLDHLPEKVVSLGLTYFLEIFIALECIEDYASYLGRSPTVQEICTRVIYYATYDA